MAFSSFRTSVYSYKIASVFRIKGPDQSVWLLVKFVPSMQNGFDF